MPVTSMKQFSRNNCAETAVSFALKDQDMIEDVGDFHKPRDQVMIGDVGYCYNLAWVCGYKVCYIAMQDNISSQSSLDKSKL